VRLLEELRGCEVQHEAQHEAQLSAAGAEGGCEDGVRKYREGMSDDADAEASSARDGEAASTRRMRGASETRPRHGAQACFACDSERSEPATEGEVVPPEGEVVPPPSEPEAASPAEEAAATFARRVRADPRFEVLWVRGRLVCFRLVAWYSAEAETLNAELLSEVNASVSGSGRSWIAPTREGSGDDGGGGRDSLSLLHASGPRTSPAVCWADVKAATERVMLRHMGEFVCGGCDCLDTLAGQVLV